MDDPTLADTTRDRRPPAPARSRLVLAVLAPLVMLLAIAAVTAPLGSPPDVGVTPVVGRAAAAFDLEALDGQRLSLASLRGSPVVLNFWASWCVPCREEAPLLTGLAASGAPTGLRVIGVIYQDSAQNARAFMRTYGQTYPALVDPEGRTAIDYGVLGIPETFFIDASGVIRAHQVGALVSGDLPAQLASIGVP